MTRRRKDAKNFIVGATYLGLRPFALRVAQGAFKSLQAI
jgi:hypothetical protein